MIFRRATGWWGIPGGPESRSTKVHVKEDGKPICGSRMANNQRFQWCAWGAHWDYIECERCKDMIRREIQENHARRCQSR